MAIIDPYSIEEIAAAVGRLATDPDLRSQLILKGKSRLKDFSWERTAKAYRALYRRIARRSLTDEDEFLLSWDWMGKPHMKREGIA
jgi:glycogen synthase